MNPLPNPLPNLLPNLLPLRLPPGADLRLSLESHCKAGDAGGYFVLSGIGSLHDPRIRFAGEDEARVLRGPFEVVDVVVPEQRAAGGGRGRWRTAFIQACRR